jgi:hypothetical protein
MRLPHAVEGRGLVCKNNHHGCRTPAHPRRTHPCCVFLCWRSGWRNAMSAASTALRLKTQPTKCCTYGTNCPLRSGCCCDRNSADNNAHWSVVLYDRGNDREGLYRADRKNEKEVLCFGSQNVQKRARIIWRADRRQADHDRRIWQYSRGCARRCYPNG